MVGVGAPHTAIKARVLAHTCIHSDTRVHMHLTNACSHLLL